MGEGKQQMMTIFCFSFFLSFHTQLLLGQWKVGAIVFFSFRETFSSSDCFIWPGRAESAAREKEREERVSKEYLNMIISFFCILNYFNISTQVRRIREAQEEERRRKLEELKQHVSFFTGFFIGPKSDHCLALSVSQSVHLLAEICPNWICKAEANTKFWQLVWLAGSASAEVPWAAGGVEKETHWRAEEQRHGQKSTGLSISWKTFLRIKIIR